MALTTTYLLAVKNLEEMLASIRRAQAPERFTTRFLADLGFRSTNDRAFVTMLKPLGFIDESGVPKQRYFDYLDEGRHRQVLADGVREAYADLFKLDQKANEHDNAWVKNKLKVLTQGSKGEVVLNKMALTFVSLCKHADFRAPAVPLKQDLQQAAASAEQMESKSTEKEHSRHSKHPLGLSYNINIELPAVRDPLVYDAIFKALKDHLL